MAQAEIFYICALFPLRKCNFLKEIVIWMALFGKIFRLRRATPIMDPRVPGPIPPASRPGAGAGA